MTKVEKENIKQMLKKYHYITQLSGFFLIIIGILNTISTSLYLLLPIKQLLLNITEINKNHVGLFLLLTRSFLVIAFSFLFIFSGIGVLRLKEWARKLSLLTLGLFILIMIPVPHVNLQIVIVKIVFICISLSIIYLLSLKNVKKQFSKG